MQTPGRRDLAELTGPPRPIPYETGDKPKKRLLRNRVAHKQPHAFNLVRAVYPNALELAGYLATGKGFGIFSAVVALALFGWIVFMVTGFWSFSGQREPWMIMLDLVFLLVGMGAVAWAWVFLRQDMFAYRDEPVLFSRNTGKVHVFRRRTNLRKPFSPWPVVIDTYDWNCVRGEIFGGFQLVGGSTPAVRYRLLITVTDGPKTSRVIDRFHVGHDAGSQNDLVRNWEHIRRYMEEDGPPLTWAGEFASGRRFSHRRALINSGLIFLDKDFWQGFRDEPIYQTFWLLFLVVTLPVMLPVTLMGWVAHATSCDPWWTEQILAEAGGAPLPEAEVLAKYGDSATGDAHHDQAHQSDGIDSPNDDGLSPTRSWWLSAENRKFVFAILGALGVIVLAKFLQTWWRG